MAEEAHEMTDAELLRRLDHRVAEILAHTRTNSVRLNTIRGLLMTTTDEIKAKLDKLGADIGNLVTEEQAAAASALPAGSVAVDQATLDAIGAHVDQLDQAVSTAAAGQPVTPPAPATAAAGTPPPTATT